LGGGGQGPTKCENMPDFLSKFKQLGAKIYKGIFRNYGSD
jgi:hypothetical protein